MWQVKTQRATETSIFLKNKISLPLLVEPLHDAATKEWYVETSLAFVKKKAVFQEDTNQAVSYFLVKEEKFKPGNVNVSLLDHFPFSHLDQSTC